MSTKRDLTGDRFGLLVAIREVGRDKKGGLTWECLCDCGEIAVKSGANLTRGHVKTCGRGEHRKTNGGATPKLIRELNIYQEEEFTAPDISRLLDVSEATVCTNLCNMASRREIKKVGESKEVRGGTTRTHNVYRRCKREFMGLVENPGIMDRADFEIVFQPFNPVFDAVMMAAGRASALGEQFPVMVVDEGPRPLVRSVPLQDPLSLAWQIDRTEACSLAPRLRIG